MSDDQDHFASVPGPLREAMLARGFTALTAVQRAVVAANTRDTNLRISSQTGSGKTVAIGLALAEVLLDEDSAGAGQPRVLIIAPTRELAAQLDEELTWLYAGVPRFRSCAVTGGTDIQRERRALRKGPTVVVGTPGRTLDHIRAGALVVDGIEHVVLDEADHMLDLGFKEELDAITDALPGPRRSHLVSATFPKPVRRFADRFQPDALHLEGTRLGEANEDIEHSAYLVAERDRYPALVNILLLTDGARCLVFVRRRVDTTEIAEQLAADGFSALPFSGDLSQAQRTRTLAAFRNDVVRILVATDVAARGIDVADIATIVHIDLPNDPETYTHRSGRTGRAGQKGRSILIAPPRAERRLRRVLVQAKVDADWGKLPSPKRIQKALDKRARKRIFEATSREDAPSEADLDYARLLLSRVDPELLVARLVEFARPELPRAPMAYSTEVRGPRGPASGGGDGNFVPFRIRFGARQGATPARLMAAVCRRGDINGRQIGAIRIGKQESAFEVDAGVAEQFLERAAQPDPRNPGETIERIAELPDYGPARRPPRSRGRFKQDRGGRQGGDRRGRGPGKHNKGRSK